MEMGSVMTNVMCMISDGMDQAKFKIPRTLNLKSKLLDKLYRPNLHLAAVWIHGYRLYFYISDADLKKDPNTQIEMVSRSISDVFQSVGQLPAGLVSQQDNCFRDAKNQYYLAFMLMLVVLDIFRYTLTSFLGTGHSHEDIDQCFGQSAGLIGRHTFDTPDDLLQIVDSACEPSSKAENIRCFNYLRLPHGSSALESLLGQWFWVLIGTHVFGQVTGTLPGKLLATCVRL